MFGRGDSVTNPVTGTSHPLFVPRDAAPAQAVHPGKEYFIVQVHSAQAAFTGPIWENVERLVVTSQVNLNHKSLGNKSLRAIQRSRQVKRNRAEQLGLAPNLISLVPATMTHVSLSIDFILDKKNRLVDLAALINDDTFLKAISLAPGAAMVAQTIGGLAEKIIHTFIPAQEREPILQFAGDFNLDADNGLRDGYYVILGSTDEDNPIPWEPSLEVREGGLYSHGERVTRLSYVILDVRHSPARTRDRNDDAPWEARLREAEGEAQMIEGDPYASENQKKQTWETCRRLIQEARALLMADANYLHWEAESIFKSVYKYCADTIAGGEGTEPAGGIIKAGRGDWKPDLRTNRAMLDIPAGEDLEAMVHHYEAQVREARQILNAL